MPPPSAGGRGPSLACPAQASQVAVCACRAPGRQARQPVGAEVLACGHDLVPDAVKEGVVYQFPGGLALFVEVEDLEYVGAAAGEFLIADGVDVQLVAGDVLGLGALGGLEVDDRGFAGVQPGDQVDPAVDRDPGRDVDLDLLLGVESVL
jgi:hypothetical protein